MTRPTVLAATVIAFALTASACADGTGGTAVATPVTVTVTAPGQTVTVTASAGNLASADSDGNTTAETTGSIPESSPVDSAIPGLQSEGAGIDPCKLVTQSDAQVLAATKLSPAQKIQQTCTYTGPVNGPTAQVQVFVGPGAKKQLDIERTLSHPVRKLSATGDEAWAAENAIYVRKGTLWVSVELVLLNDPSENADRLAHLATVVAGRI